MAATDASLLAPEIPRASPHRDQSSVTSPSPPEPCESAMAPSPPPAPAGQRPPLFRSVDSSRVLPPCWSHEEVLALIEAYGMKWCELRRGSLRASDWQEVADAVRRRCLRFGTAKAPVQCRHKVEKLRQRYRAEKQRIVLRGSANKPVLSSWIYFAQMDALEIGNTIPTVVSSPWSDDGGNDSGSHNEGKPEDKQHALQLGFSGMGVRTALEFRIPKASRSKVIGHQKGTAAHRTRPGNGWFFKGFSGSPRRSTVEMTGEGGEAGKKRKKAFVWEMVTAVNTLGDEFTRVEEMKMEMAKDMEKLRMEMELKRTELMIHSQRQLLDYVTGLHDHNAKKPAKIPTKST